MCGGERKMNLYRKGAHTSTISGAAPPSWSASHDPTKMATTMATLGQKNVSCASRAFSTTPRRTGACGAATAVIAPDVRPETRQGRHWRRRRVTRHRQPELAPEAG